MVQITALQGKAGEKWNELDVNRNGRLDGDEARDGIGKGDKARLDARDTVMWGAGTMATRWGAGDMVSCGGAMVLCGGAMPQR